MSEKTSIPSFGFHHIALKAADFDRSLRFYTEGLGLTPYTFWGEDDTRACMLQLSDGGHIELFAGGGDAFAVNGKWVHFALRTDEVDAAYERALAYGAQTHQAPKTVSIPAQPHPLHLRIAFVKGPDGEIIEFFHMLDNETLSPQKNTEV